MRKRRRKEMVLFAERVEPLNELKGKRDGRRVL
jgi:hypothetical protein